MMGASQYVYLKEAADLLEVSHSFIYKHYDDNDWPSYEKVGIKIRWRRPEFEEWRNSRGRKSA